MTTQPTPTTQPARVCVLPFRESRAVKTEQAKPRDGAATPPRGRVLRTRQAIACTTTKVTLLLDSSSKGRESNDTVTEREY